MNTMTLGRLAWKEFRVLRDFWVAIAALCGLCLLIMGYRMKPTDDPAALFYVVMGVTAFYALGCGTMAFAGEREARTDDFQRALPVSPRNLLWGKLLFALASTLVLGIVLWLLALLAALEGWSEVRTRTSLVASGATLALLGGLTALQLLAWSLFFSLRSSHPLRVVILACLANAVVSYPIWWLLGDVPEEYRTALYFPSFFGDLPTVIPRLIVVAVVFWLDFRLVQRWVRDAAGGGAATPGATIATLTQATGWRSRWNVFPPQWRRLTWQEWRSSRFMIALTALTYVFLVILMDSMKTRSDFQQPLLVGPLMVVGGLLGTFAFHSDQRRRQYRFLTEHGVSPRRLWWTRQACWFAVLLVFCLVAASIDYARWRAAFSGWTYRPPRWHGWYAQCDGGFIGLAIICYCVGQLLSLWVHSAVVRWTTAVLYCLPVVFWAMLMASLDVPLVWSVAPIPVVLLIASRASVRDWMVERTGRAVRLKSTLILVIPALAIAAGVIVYRWTEIPNIEPQFTTRDMTPAELAAAKAKGEEYLHAMESFDPWLAGIPDDPNREDRVRHDVDPAEFTVAWLTEEQKQWLDQHRELIESTLQVTAGEYARPWETEYWKKLIASGKAPAVPEGWDTDEWATYVFFRKVIDMTDILLKSALVSQKDGDLDRALDRYVAALGLDAGLRSAEMTRSTSLVREHYPHIAHCLRYWAAEPGQTPERIRRALQAIERTAVIMPDLESQFEQYYLDLRQRLVSGDVETNWVSWHHRDPSYGKWLRWFYRLLPWEHQRVIRLHHTSTAYSLTAVTETRRAIERHEPVNVPVRQDPDMERVRRWSDTTLIPDPSYVPWWWDYYPSQLVEMTAVQRVTLIVLALHGWRLEHGTFPKSLDELSPSWLSEIPVDPWTGKQFTYCPDGENESVKWFDEGLQFSFLLPPHAPFIEAMWPIPDYYKTHPDKEPPRDIFPIPAGK